MKRASYRDAVRWIAQMDSAGEVTSMQECAELITSALVADIFGVDDARVGRDVWREHERAAKAHTP